MKQAQIPDVDIKRVIGAGCFGVVLEAEYRSSNKKCALKRIQKVGNQLSREYQILEMIKGMENVVQMEQIFYTKDETGMKLVQNIVFEFLDSNLENLIQEAQRNKTTIKQSLIKKYIYQLMNGLKNIHKLQIAHRDLKPENVLLSEKGQVKICDFGSSKIIDPEGKNTPYIVSRYYRAPELILCLTKYSTAIDVWAAGCILAQLYTLLPFFKGKSEGDQMFAIASRLGKFSKTEKSYYKERVPYDSSILDTFDAFTKQDFNQTFKMSKDKANLIDLLERMLRYDPTQRITAKQALNHPYFDDVRNIETVEKTVKK